MNEITYHGVKYRPSQFWPLVRALQRSGYIVRIDCIGGEIRYVVNSVHGPFFNKSPFAALGKLVAEIQKAVAK